MNRKIMKSISCDVATIKLIAEESTAYSLINKITPSTWCSVFPFGCTLGEMEVNINAAKLWIHILDQIDATAALNVAVRLSRGVCITELIEAGKEAYEAFTHLEPVDTHNPFFTTTTLGKDQGSQMMTALLFLSRFCPSKAQSAKLEAQTLREFLTLQNELRQLSDDQSLSERQSLVVPLSQQENKWLRVEETRRWNEVKHVLPYMQPRTHTHNSLFALMRDFFQDIIFFRSGKVLGEQSVTVDPWEVFTTGACSNTKEAFAASLKENRDKIGKLALLRPWLEYLTGMCYPGDRWFQRYELGLEVFLDEMHIMAVPKNYSKSRIIAPCSVLTSAVGKNLFFQLAEIIKNLNNTCNGSGHRVLITYEDQLINRDLAYLGSLAGEWDTIDLKSASDRNREDVLDAIVPGFASRIRNSIPHFMNYNGKRYKLGSLALAGDPATYNLECIYFWIGVFYAISIVDKYDGLQQGCVCNLGEDHFLEDDVVAVLCGDDIIVHHRYTETVIDVLTAMGCIVNESKSFVGILENNFLFRESCGGFFCNGWSFNPIFYPRQNIWIQGKRIAKNDFKTSWNGSESYLSSSLATSVALANALREFPRAQLEMIDFILEHTQEGEVTMSNDMAETGVRTSLAEVRQHTKPRYAVIKHFPYYNTYTVAHQNDARFSRGEGNPPYQEDPYCNWGHYWPHPSVRKTSDTLRFRSVFSSTRESRDCAKRDEELIPRYWKEDAIHSSLHEDYLGYLNHESWSFINFNLYNVVDWLRYQEYLAYGPQYEDDLMELLGCSSRRTFF